MNANTSFPNAAVPLAQLTPREVLVSLLREIDSGKLSPVGLLVCYFRKQGDGIVTSLRQSTMTGAEAATAIDMVTRYLLSG